MERSPFRFDSGQQPDDPPLKNVVIQGNLVHNPGPARYQYAVIIANGPNAPQGLHFSNNVFPPGKGGVSNQPLAP